MGDEENPIIYDLFPTLRVYRDGQIRRFHGDALSTGVDPITGVQSKDISIPKSGASVRLYIHKTTDHHHRKLPLLIYIHGGGFLGESNSSALYHPHLNKLVANCDVIAVSIEYRLAPEHPLPAAYDDSWAAIQWVATHNNGFGPELWLNQYADFQNVYFAGDSAGANISHHMAIRVGYSPTRFRLAGILLVHPYFGGVEPIPDEDLDGKRRSDEMWAFAKPDSSGSDDPDFNPDKDPRVSGMGCERILVCVAGKDLLRARGLHYTELMRKSGWKGEIEVVEDEDHQHCFHLHNPKHEKTIIQRFQSFINQV